MTVIEAQPAAAAPEPMRPFFVYGTLLPGQPNDGLWEGAVRALRPAIFPGGRLHDLGAYPMLVEDEESGQVQGALVEVEPTRYGAVLARLDHLEGYNPASPDHCTYCRRQWTVQLAGGAAVLAWVYLGRAEAAAGFPIVPGGDWVAYSATRLGDIAAWWKGINTVGDEPAA